MRLVPRLAKLEEEAPKRFPRDEDSVSYTPEGAIDWSRTLSSWLEQNRQFRGVGDGLVKVMRPEQHLAMLVVLGHEVAQQYFTDTPQLRSLLAEMPEMQQWETTREARTMREKLIGVGNEALRELGRDRPDTSLDATLDALFPGARSELTPAEDKLWFDVIVSRLSGDELAELVEMAHEGESDDEVWRLACSRAQVPFDERE